MGISADLWAELAYLSDYVGYGTGGSDATAYFLSGTFPLPHEPAHNGVNAPPEPEQLMLLRPGGVERLSLEGLVH